MKNPHPNLFLLLLIQEHALYPPNFSWRLYLIDISLLQNKNRHKKIALIPKREFINPTNSFLEFEPPRQFFILCLDLS